MISPSDVASRIVNDWNRNVQAILRSIKLDYFQQIQDSIKRSMQPLFEFQDLVRKITEPFRQMIRRLQNDLRHNFINGIWHRLRLVVDANCVIAHVLGFFEWGTSGLLRLFQNTYFIAYAPKALVDEVERNLVIRAREKGIDEKILLSIFHSKFLPKIELIDPYYLDVDKANSLLQGHSKDADYIGLTFSIEADGLLTKENRLSRLNTVRTWVVKEADEVAWRLNPFGSIIRTSAIFQHIRGQQNFIFRGLAKNITIPLTKFPLF